ncbi:MAG: tRNA(Ile)-lysidine synthase [Lysobacterales bacterium]|nr:MAG: tRNA(Ile)-lysidine synthase [Xanthomonadales bacterium]
MDGDARSRIESTLLAWLRAHPEGALAVAFSGGGDSTALLAALSRLPQARERQLRALHVDHGLAADSGLWAAHCETLARALGVGFQRLAAEVKPSGSGIEAAARQARYRLLARSLAPGEWLLLAHHAEDQAETILLRLLRGASPRLLAGMPPLRPLGRGFLARPLLGLSRATLRAALAQYGLSGIEDPANQDPRFDRAYLRQAVLPAIAARFPRFAEHVAASGRMIGEAVACFSTDWLSDGEEDGSIRLSKLLAEPASRAALALELWLDRRGLRPPPGHRIAEFLRQLACAAPDRAPSLRGQGWRLRRFRERLFLLREPVPRLPPELDLPWDGEHPLVLPDGSRLELRGDGPGRLKLELRVRARRGGERILLDRARGHRSVKELLRASAIPPWERERLPFLWSGQRLVAVGERWLDPDFAAQLAAAGRRLHHDPPLAAERPLS